MISSKDFTESVNKKILFGIPPHSHVSLAMDELRAMEHMGYYCYTVNYGRNDKSGGKLKKIIITLRNALLVNRKMKEVRPDFLYLNSRFEPEGSVRDFLTLFVLKLLNKNLPRVIIKTHGSDLSILNTNSFLYKKIIVPFLTKNVSHWLFLSNEEKEIVQRFNPEMGQRVEVIPNIIVPERCVPTVEFKKKYVFPANKFICLFAGRITEVKGVFDIMKSISFLKHPEVFHFLFIGKGPDMEELQKAAVKYAAVTTIQFTGFLPDAECDRFYSLADVLIYPTYDSEGFPMALFKSVSCGVPVITTSLRAAKDHLKEPANVIWVKPKSPEEIAAALEKIYSDTPLRRMIIKNNRELGLKFSSEKVARQLNHILNSPE